MIDKFTRQRQWLSTVSLCLFLILCTQTLSGQAADLVTVQRTEVLMGTRVAIRVVSPAEEIGYTNIQEAIAEMNRVEELISSRIPGSVTSEINRKAGISPVKVSEEFYRLVERCLQLSEITQGAFDITSLSAYDSAVSREGYRNLHFRSLVETARKGYKTIRLDQEEHTVFLSDPKYKISFGGIGRGYAVEKARTLLRTKGVPGGMIHAGGAMCSWGEKATGEQWLLGIADPLRNGYILDWVQLGDWAASISGRKDEQWRLRGALSPDGIDPRSRSGVQPTRRVTVFARNAELADALATALHIMDPLEGMALVNQLEGTEAIIEDARGHLHQSLGMPAFMR